MVAKSGATQMQELSAHLVCRPYRGLNRTLPCALQAVVGPASTHATSADHVVKSTNGRKRDSANFGAASVSLGSLDRRDKTTNTPGHERGAFFSGRASTRVTMGGGGQPGQLA